MKRLCLAILTVLSSCGVFAYVTITTLVVAQRPGTKLVDITYDVSSTTASAVNVSLTVSNGAVAVSAINLTGAVGAGVLTGTGKSITWNMGADWNGNAAALSFSVWANDGPICPVAKTGQTTSYRTGDDGDLETGVAWLNSRFIVVTNGTDQTVFDNLTGLEWVQETHALSGNSGATSWNAAVDFCNNLFYADHSDWRLPSRKELMSLIDYGRSPLAMPVGHPFSGVTANCYWSGTSFFALSGRYAWGVIMKDGLVGYYIKSNNNYVWPVRGGQ